MTARTARFIQARSEWLCPNKIEHIACRKPYREKPQCFMYHMYKEIASAAAGQGSDEKSM